MGIGLPDIYPYGNPENLDPTQLSDRTEFMREHKAGEHEIDDAYYGEQETSTWDTLDEPRKQSLLQRWQQLVERIKSEDMLGIGNIQSGVAVDALKQDLARLEEIIPEDYRMEPAGLIGGLAGDMQKDLNNGDY